MKFLRTLASAFKLAKKQAAEAQISKELTDDPITVEMIARIAKDFGYHFEVQQKDGTILRFYKRIGEAEDPQTGVW